MSTHSPLAGLPLIVPAKTRRISSYDRSGGNTDCLTGIAPGQTAILAEIPGAGIIKHIWVTINCEAEAFRRDLILRMYWDGQEHPCVEAPIGDFFGQGWGEYYDFISLPIAAAPVEGRAMNCYFPMPFGQGARITIENQTEKPVLSFYYYIDFEEHASIPDEMGRFCAWYNQELTRPESNHGDLENEWQLLKAEDPKNPSDKNNYLFCEVEGTGHFVGVNYYVNCPSPMWYGEGDDMFLVDGEGWPGSAHGTGTEDYFNMSWCPSTPYAHPYFGLGRVPGHGNKSAKFGWLGRTHCYRFHLEDPVRFSKSLRASIEHGHANVLTLEMASVAYWYQTLPTRVFPPLPNAAARKPRPEIGLAEVHRWRDAWRQAHGGGALWGDEK